MSRSSREIVRVTWYLLALGLVLTARLAVAQVAGEHVARHGIVAENLYVAGGSVEVAAEVTGDVLAAGGRVNIEGHVSEDVAAAGGDVRVGAETGGDLRVVGGSVMVGGRTGGDIVAAGGRVVLTRDAKVAGKAWVAGGTVEVVGSVGKWLRVAGRTVRIGGEVQGDVSVIAQQLEILPTARIAGNLTYYSSTEAVIAADGRIAGTVTRRPLELDGQISRTMSWILQAVRYALYAGLIVAGIAYILLFPEGSRRAGRILGEHPWRSLAVGVALLVATPAAVLLLIVAVLSLPLGLVVLALYLVALLAGFLTSAVCWGDAGLRRLGRDRSPTWRIGAVVLTLVALALIRQIPFAGATVHFLTLLLGLGALGIHASRLYRGADA